MTHNFNSLSSPTAFLDSEFATEEDAGLISQIEIWSINSRVFDTFGVDTEMVVSGRLLPQLRRLSIALDTWRADWSDQLSRTERLSSYSKTRIDLHFYFAKLYLCSHVFRGPQPEISVSYYLSSEMEEFANLALHSASSIIRVVVIDHEIQSILSDLPTYFHTMLAFAAVFLLKMARKGPANVKVDKEEIFGLIEQLIRALTIVTTGMHPQHLLYSIATSIGKLLQTTRQSQSTSAVPDSVTGSMNDQDWLVPSSDALFLGNYDFFYPQDTDLDFDFSEPGNIPIPHP